MELFLFIILQIHNQEVGSFGPSAIFNFELENIDRIAKDLAEQDRLNVYLKKRRELRQLLEKSLEKSENNWQQFKIIFPENEKTEKRVNLNKKNDERKFKISNDFSELSEMIFSTASKIDNPDPYILDNAFQPGYKYMIDPTWVRQRPQLKYD